MAKRTTTKTAAKPAVVTVVAETYAAPALNLDLLCNVVKTCATNGEGWCFAALTDDLLALNTAGLVQVDASTKDATNSNVATMPTSHGIKKVNEMQAATNNAPAFAAAPAAEDYAYKIEDNVPMPTRERAGGSGIGKAKYPFAALNIGQSFVVPSTTMKKFSSTIGAANRRYNADSIPQGDRRTFTGFPEGDGVRVFRTEWRKPRVMTRTAVVTPATA